MMNSDAMQHGCPLGASRTPNSIGNYMQTESVIPSDWVQTSLREIAPLQRGFDLPTSNIRPGPYPIVYSNGVLGHHHRPMVKGPGVVTGRSGTIGRVHFIDKDYWPHNTSLWVTSFCGNDPKFVYYLYNHINLARMLSGSGVPTLHRNDVHQYMVARPPPAEQRTIAEALSDVDELMGALEALIAKKQAIKQAAMQQIFSGKTRLSGLCDEWPKIALGRIGETYGGLSGKSGPDFGVGNSRYVTFLAVLENIIVDASHTERVHVTPSESQNSILEGDLLINGTSETPEDLAMGSVMSEEVDCIYLNSFCFGFRIRDTNRHVPIFLAYLFRSTLGRELVSSLAQGATRYNLSKAQFLALEVPLPTYEEQREIVAVLSDLDAEIAALEKRRDKTRAVKQGMMEQLLTGRVRLV